MAKAKSVELAPITPHFTTIPIFGEDLLMHAWAVKQIRTIAGKQGGKATKPREAKDPEAEWRATLYRGADDPDIFGVPCAAFRKAIVRASSLHGFKMVDTRQALFIEKDLDILDGRGIMSGVRIFGRPEMHLATVKLGGKTADLRYRGRFRKWGALLKVQHLTTLTPEQVLTLVQFAGFSVGVCDWRPEKDGEFGRWRPVALETLLAEFPDETQHVRDMRVLADSEVHG